MVIRQVLLQSSVECHAITTDATDWRGEIRGLIKKQDDGCTLRPEETKKIARFLLVGDDMYRR